MRKPRETDFFKNAGHFAQPIKRHAVGFTQLDAERMEREHRPVGEPAAPFGVGGSSGLATTCLAFATELRVKRRISDVNAICLFAFYRDNGAVASQPSETTEPNMQRPNQALNGRTPAEEVIKE